MPTHAAETRFHELRSRIFPLQPKCENFVGCVILLNGDLRQSGDSVQQIPPEVPRQGCGKDVAPPLPAPLPRPPEGVRQMGSGEEPGLGQD